MGRVKMISVPLTLILLSLSSFGLSELAPWMMNPLEQEPDVKDSSNHYNLQELLGRSLMLDTCEIQTKMLDRLKDLVTNSIIQVKMCMNMKPTSPYSKTGSKSISI